MNESEVIKYLIEIKENLALLNAKIEETAKLAPRMDKIEKEIVEAKMAVKVLRWGLGVLLISVPATAVAIVKVLGFVKS